MEIVEFDKKVAEIEKFGREYSSIRTDEKYVAYNRVSKNFLRDILEFISGLELEDLIKKFEIKAEERKTYTSEHANRYRESLAKFMLVKEEEFRLFQVEVEKFFSGDINEFRLFEFRGKIEDLNIYQVYNKYYDNGSLNAFFSSLNKPMKLESEDEVVNKKKTKQKIYVGAPGVGKSYSINQTTINVKERFKTRIVFHPDYENHDFVGSILPVVSDGNVTYEFNPGPFTRCLKSANEYPEEMHYLIIEEITRGNASAIFGEVFQLLDRNESGISEYPITNKDMAVAIYGEERCKDENYDVIIPDNVSILATANTSDQNVFVLDTAFKRRFEFKYLDVEVEDTSALPNVNVFGHEWKNIYMKINDYIVDILGMAEDKQVGPFFITKKSELNKLCRYLWEDIDKASFLSENTIFSEEYSRRFSKINKLCNEFNNGNINQMDISRMLSTNFKKFITVGENSNERD